MRGGTAFLPIFTRFPSPRAPPRSIVQRLSARRASARRAHMQNQHEPAAFPAFSSHRPRRRNPLRHHRHRRTSPRHTRTRHRTRRRHRPRRHRHPTNHRRPTNSRRSHGASCRHRPPCPTRRARSPPSPRCTGRARIPCPHDLSFPVVPRSEARPTRATGRARARVTRGGGPSRPPLGAARARRVGPSRRPVPPLSPLIPRYPRCPVDPADSVVSVDSSVSVDSGASLFIDACAVIAGEIVRETPHAMGAPHTRCGATKSAKPPHALRGACPASRPRELPACTAVMPGAIPGQSRVEQIQRFGGGCDV